MTHPYRTHNCGALTAGDIGQEVRLSGWVHRRRDHGNLLFIDLRDHYGITQIVVTAEDDFLQEATHLRYETVVTITGQVLARSAETVNKELATGEIEVKVTSLTAHATPKMLPLQVNSDKDFPEATRLTYRFLDLRREKMHRNIMLRSRVISSLRRKMEERGFTDFQTPILTSSSPEGARDYLVPSRVHPGCFYALPQAPQQFKQLLMMSGFDRYFQIAPCFRDEDARADRSPGEFYQLDMEMAFATQEDVFSVMEPVLREVFEEFAGNRSVTGGAFPRIPYKQAMLEYGCDKPDLRNPIKISDVSDVFAGSEFATFARAVASGKVVRAIPAPGTGGNARSFFDKKIDFAKSHGAAGLGYVSFKEGEAKGPIAKFLNAERVAQLREVSGVGDGDSVFFSCDEERAAADLAGKVRTLLGQELNLIDESRFEFCWVVDFPYFEWDEERGKIDFSHNPFSMPQGGLDALTQAGGDGQKLLDITAWQYDIVCNGIELSSGAVRNHLPELMFKAFEIVGYSRAEVEAEFGGMIRAFSYGAPPHAGIAPGVDRIVMLLAGEENIREVIAFPMNQQAEDLLMGAPAPVPDGALNELHIQHSFAAKEALEKRETVLAERKEQERALEEALERAGNADA